MYFGPYTTSSGKEIVFEQLRIRRSSLGFLEGSPERIREIVLGQLPDEVRRRFGETGVLIHEPPAGALPNYTVFVALECYEPIQPEAACSALVVVWFLDSIPENLLTELQEKLQGIEWEKHAKDGWY